MQYDASGYLREVKLIRVYFTLCLWLMIAAIFITISKYGFVDSMMKPHLWLFMTGVLCAIVLLNFGKKMCCVLSENRKFSLKFTDRGEVLIDSEEVLPSATFRVFGVRKPLLGIQIGRVKLLVVDMQQGSIRKVFPLYGSAIDAVLAWLKGSNRYEFKDFNPKNDDIVTSLGGVVSADQISNTD